MNKNRIRFKQAVDFHGHLGPYLILGLLAGELALKEVQCRKYFGLNVKVYGANKKPESCLVDGLQLSTGATYGKGNIQKAEGDEVRISIRNLQNNKKITLKLNKELVKRLKSLKGHKDSKEFAKQLIKTNSSKIFNLRTDNR